MVKTVIKDLKNKTSYSVSYLYNNNVSKTLSKKGIIIRKALSPLLRLIYKGQTKYTLEVDSREEIPKNDKGTIFILNHRQADDIVLGVNVIGKSGYILFGNKDLLLETPNGLGLWAYGVIPVDRANKESRQASYEKMKYVINNGGNIFVWAGGYWNLDDNGLADKEHGADDHNSESWLIEDFNIGPFRLAQETGAYIVPGISHYDEVKDKVCFGRRGKAFKVEPNDDVFEKKDQFKEYVQTEYYDLMEKYSTYNRRDLETKRATCYEKFIELKKQMPAFNERISLIKQSNLSTIEKYNLIKQEVIDLKEYIGDLRIESSTLKEEWEKLKTELIAACDIKRINYKLDLDNEKLIGKAKVVNPVVTNEEAFEHLNNINYNIDNRHLLSKRYTGLRK